MDDYIKRAMKALASNFEDKLLGIMNESWVHPPACTCSGVAQNQINMQAIYEAKRLLELQSTPAPIKIYTDDRMTERVQYKFPRKKKNRRWDKKYWKKYSRVQPMRKAFLCDSGSLTGLKTKRIVCHPAMEKRIMEQIKGMVPVLINENYWRGGSAIDGLRERYMRGKQQGGNNVYKLAD